MILDNSIGILGGEAIFSNIDDLWENSSVLGTCNAATLDTNGPEWPTKPKSLELEGKLGGGLGSSWSSLIWGEVIRVREALGDTFGDDDREQLTGLVGPRLLVNGPEKACLLIFLE